MKNVTIKVYRPTGEFIKNWNNAKFVGFTKMLNSGLGSCMIELGEVMTYSGYDLELNNNIQILITDKDTENADENPKLIYSGYISNYVPWINSSGQGVYVYLLGYYTKLAQDIWKNDTTTTFTYNTLADPGTMFRNLMDRYVAETTNPKMYYSLGSLQLTGTTAKYLFEMTTYREAIDILLSMSPNGWFWYVDELGLVYFKAKPTTPTHKFIYGRHFSLVRIERSMEKLKNALLFWNGQTDADQVYKLYTNTDSIAKYGRRIVRRMDERAIDTGGGTDTADKIGAKFVAEHKDPDVKVIVDIIDNNEDSVNGYDIESIQPGDTCVLEGFDESLTDLFEYNMLITSVEYTLNKVTLIIEPLQTGIVERQEQIGKNVEELADFGAPTDYTT